MNEILKEKLGYIAEDDNAVMALKALMNEVIELPAITDKDTDAVIGQKYRAYIEAKKMMREFFNKLSLNSYKKEKPKNDNRGI